jgi:hypothetical protein
MRTQPSTRQPGLSSQDRAIRARASAPQAGDAVIREAMTVEIADREAFISFLPERYQRSAVYLQLAFPAEG